MIKKYKKINYADYIRVIAMLLILLCHFVQQNDNSYIQMTAQIFNIGVSIFFILSGFLFGINSENITDWKTWFIKRLKRIFVSYWLFVAILAIVYLIQGRDIFTLNWLLLIFGLQGSNVGVLGAEQTWFISSILICYLFTPLIKHIAYSKHDKKLALLIFIPCLLAFVKPAWPSTLLDPLVTYSFGFLVGKNLDKVTFKMKYLIMSLSLLVIAFGSRFVSKFLFDDTIMYERIIVTYCSIVGAFCIFYILSYLFRNIEVNRFIKWMSSISFEVYLFHYMFTVGPVSIFSGEGANLSWMIRSLLTYLVTVIISTLVHTLSDKVMKVLK